MLTILRACWQSSGIVNIANMRNISNINNIGKIDNSEGLLTILRDC